MNSIRTPYAAKGQFKCFHCRLKVRSKDGNWCEILNQQVFLCKECETARARMAERKPA